MLIAVNYHYIRDIFDYPFPGIMGVKPSEFESQLDILGSMGEFIHPEEVSVSLDKISSPKNIYFLITFDDGLAEQYNLALPILKRKGIPAMFYVNAVNIVEKKISPVHQLHILRSTFRIETLKEFFFNEINDLNDDIEIELTDEDKSKAIRHYIYDSPEVAIFKYQFTFKLNFNLANIIIGLMFAKHFSVDQESIANKLYMSKENINGLARLKILGNHSYHHLPLGLLPQTEMEQEIKNSTHALTDLTGVKPFSFSYPYGSKEAVGQSFQILEKEGYQWGVTMERAANIESNNIMTLSRYACNDLPGGSNPIFKNKKDILRNAKTRNWFL